MAGNQGSHFGDDGGQFFFQLKDTLPPTGFPSVVEHKGMGWFMMSPIPQKIFTKSPPQRSGLSQGGYLVFGRIHMMDFGLGRPTHPCTKILCSNPSMYQNFLLITHPVTKFHSIFIVKPIHVPKIHAQNPSKPIYVPKFHDFLENDPPMSVHFRFKTHPCTSIIRIHENIWVPPGGLSPIGPNPNGNPASRSK